MEEVPRAPVPEVVGYTVHTFYLCPTWIGEEQRRRRQISFGLLQPMEADLRQFIEYVALEVMEAEGAVTQTRVNNSDEAKGRVKTATQPAGHGPAPGQRRKTKAVTSNRSEVPVAIGGTGKLKRTKTLPVTEQNTFEVGQDGRVKRGVVTGSDGGESVRMERYRDLGEMCRLQGLPEDFFDKDSPFRMDAKRQLIGNAVPLPMARALAKAVRQAMRQESNQRQ